MPITPTRSRSTAASSSRQPVVELPAPRRSTRATSNTPNRSQTRASSSTPAHSPHMSKADELAAEEAEEILEHVEGSARSRRHARLSRLREESEQPSIEYGIELGEEVSPPASPREERSGAASRLESIKDEENEDDERDAADQEESVAEEPSTVVPDDQDPLSLAGSQANETGDDERDADSSSSSSSASDSDDSTSATSDEEDDSDDSDDDDEDEKLEQLLQAARIAAVKSTASRKENEFAEGDEMVSFDKDELAENRRKEAPIPDISITAMPKPHLHFTADGAVKAADARPIIAGPSRPKKSTTSSSHAPELDDRPYERPLSKREKAAQPKKATASELWSALPAPKADLLPQMKKDYQALALANSLDPKRFMKGGSRTGKVPDTFAIGTLVEAPRHVQDTTMTREKQYRPGQVVQGLIRDDATGSYAKRKYGDLQKTRMDNGRGRGWKKQKGW